MAQWWDDVVLRPDGDSSSGVTSDGDSSDGPKDTNASGGSSSGASGGLVAEGTRAAAQWWLALLRAGSDGVGLTGGEASGGARGNCGQAAWWREVTGRPPKEGTGGPGARGKATSVLTCRRRLEKVAPFSLSQYCLPMGLG